jgi:hypothetical protein
MYLGITNFAGKHYISITGLSQITKFKNNKNSESTLSKLP